MRYEADTEQVVAGAPTDVAARAAAVMAALGAKVRPVASGGDTGTREVGANFNKKVGSRYLQNRVEVLLRLHSVDADPSRTRVLARAWPVDPVGRPLGFGVLGQPAADVLGEVMGALEGAG